MKNFKCELNLFCQGKKNSQVSIEERDSTHDMDCGVQVKKREMSPLIRTVVYVVCMYVSHLLYCMVTQEKG